MSLQRPTIVIFDMDGTAVRHVNPRILHILEVLDDMVYRLNRIWGWVFRRNRKGPVIPPDDAADPRRLPRLLVHRAIHKVRRKEVDEIVQPCPGLYEVLGFLKTRNVETALVSNGLGKGYGHDIMHKFGLEPYFKASVFREDIRKSKPSPEPLLLAIQRLGVAPTEKDVVWFIGDRHKDILAALALRDHIPARVVPIAYGMHAAVAALEKGLGPDHIVTSFYDLHDRLEDLFKGFAR